MAAQAAFGHDSDIMSMSPDGIVSINKGKPPKNGDDTAASDPANASPGDCVNLSLGGAANNDPDGNPDPIISF